MTECKISLCVHAAACLTILVPPLRQAALEKFDIVLASALLIGTSFYSVYMCRYATSFDAKASYQVYDGAAVAAANWLLPVREAPSPNVSSRAYLAPELLSGLNISLPSDPYQPGRYVLFLLVACMVASLSEETPSGYLQRLPGLPPSITSLPSPPLPPSTPSLPLQVPPPSLPPSLPLTTGTSSLPAMTSLMPTPP